MRTQLRSIIARAGSVISSSSTSFPSVAREARSTASPLSLEYLSVLDFTRQFDFGRLYSSVAVVDEADDRPPSLRKSTDRNVEVVLRAFPRNKTGKNWCKKHRRLGLVPSIVFEQENGHEGGNKQLLLVEKTQMENLVKKIGRSFFMSKTFDLEIYDRPGGECHSREKVLPRTIQFRSTSGELLNVTFMRAMPHSLLKVDVPLVVLGEDSCPGIRKGGYINTVRRTVPFLCPGDAIPPFLEIDISSLDVGHKVLLKDLKVSPEIRLRRKDNTLPILKIMGTRQVEGAVEAAAAK